MLNQTTAKLSDWYNAELDDVGLIMLRPSKIASTIRILCSYTYSPTYVHFGPWKKQRYAKIVLVGQY